MGFHSPNSTWFFSFTLRIALLLQSWELTLWLLPTMTPESIPEPPSSKTESPILWVHQQFSFPGASAEIWLYLTTSVGTVTTEVSNVNVSTFAGTHFAAVGPLPAPHRTCGQKTMNHHSLQPGYLGKSELIVRFFIMNCGISVIYCTKSWDLHRNKQAGKGAGRQDLSQVSHVKPSPLFGWHQGQKRPWFSWDWMKSEVELSVMSGRA